MDRRVPSIDRRNGLRALRPGMTPVLSGGPRGYWPRRRGARWRIAALLIAVAALLGAIYGGGWLLDLYRLDWATRQGIDRLARASDAAEAARALEQWDRATGDYWHPRVDQWIERVLKKNNLADGRVRRLLSYVTGVDYGERLADWQRWNADRLALRAGRQPQVPSRQQVALSQRWQAPVGLTAWFSTILPIDGQIYVATLGGSFDDSKDNWDGVVRVDGKTGQAELIFEPPERGPRDVIGIAATDDALVVACRNGFVYCIRPDGRLIWKASAAARVVSVPVVFERDRRPHIAVATAAGRVVAFDAANGRTPWTTAVELGRAAESAAAGLNTPELTAIRAALAVGEIGGKEMALLVTTTGGHVEALAAGSGKTLWQRSLDSDIFAPPVCWPASGDGPSAAFGDVQGRLWALARFGRDLSASVAAWLPDSDGGFVAAPRTIADTGASSDVLVSSAGLRDGGILARFGENELRWRYRVAGPIRATPAVADLNADGQPEIVVLSGRAGESGPAGMLTVVSHEGQCLRRLELESTVDCSPAVADVDADGLLDVLIADRNGLMTCYSAGKFGAVQWGVYGGDPRNARQARSAYTYGQTPCGYQWRWRPSGPQ